MQSMWRLGPCRPVCPLGKEGHRAEVGGQCSALLSRACYISVTVDPNAGHREKPVKRTDPFHFLKLEGETTRVRAGRRGLPTSSRFVRGFLPRPPQGGLPGLCQVFVPGEVTVQLPHICVPALLHPIIQHSFDQAERHFGISAGNQKHAPYTVF